MIYHFQLIGTIWDADCVIRFLLFKDARNLKFLWKTSDFSVLLLNSNISQESHCMNYKYTRACKFDLMLPIHRPPFASSGLSIASILQMGKLEPVSNWPIQEGLTEKSWGARVPLESLASWITLAKCQQQWKLHQKAQKSGMLVLNDNG